MLLAKASGADFWGRLFVGYSQTEAYRLWLDVLAYNARARHVYRSHGFVEEGVLRNAYELIDESRIDLILMSLRRPD
jgi:diamine N-acetyltransferase